MCPDVRAIALLIITVIPLPGCGDAAARPTLVTGEANLVAMARSIWPGVEPAGNFIPGAGWRGEAEVVSFPCLTSPGHEGRATVFVFGVPRSVDANDLDELIQHELRRFYQATAWTAIPESPVWLALGGSPQEFQHSTVHLLAPDVDVALTQYRFARQIADHHAVVVVQCYSMRMDDHIEDVEEFLTTFRNE